MSTSGCEPIRVGILGCSDIARRRFIPALLKSNYGLLAGIASSIPERAAALLSVRTCRIISYEDLLADTSIDLLYISLPNQFHEEWVLKALHQGKHVLCEKPLGLSLRSVEHMVQVAEDRGLLVYENLMYLQHPLHAVVKNAIAAGMIGAVNSLRCVFRFPFPPPGNIKLDRQGGGAFHDLNRYPLSSALFFLNGRSFRIHSVTTSENDGLNVSMDACALSSEGERFTFSIGFGFPYESFYEIGGERGSLRVDRAYTLPAHTVGRVVLTNASGVTVLDGPSADHFQLTIDHVCALISSQNGFTEPHARARILAEWAENYMPQRAEGA